jgi:hypothetical protein
MLELLDRDGDISRKLLFKIELQSWKQKLTVEWDASDKAKKCFMT